MGTIKKRIERPADIQDPNVVKVVTDFARATRCTSRGRPSLFLVKSIPSISSISGYTSTVATFCCPIRIFPSVRWNTPSGWSSFARLKTDTRFA